MTTTALPVDERRGEPRHEPEQRRLLRARRGPTTPVGSGIVKLKYGAATGFDAAEHLADLVGPARVPDPAVDRAIDGRPGARRRGAPRPPRPRRRTGRAGPPSARRRGRAPGRGSSRSCRPSPRRPCARRERRRGGPSARRGRRWRAASRRRRHDVRAARLGPRERPADVELVRLADVDPRGGRRHVTALATARRFGTAISDPRAGRRRGGRACRPRGRSPTPCSHRTATSGRSG